LSLSGPDSSEKKSFEDKFKEYVLESGVTTISSLSLHFEITSEVAKRMLEKLARDGVIKKSGNRYALVLLLVSPADLNSFLVSLVLCSYYIKKDKVVSEEKKAESTSSTKTVLSVTDRETRRSLSREVSSCSCCQCFSLNLQLSTSFFRTFLLFSKESSTKRSWNSVKVSKDRASDARLALSRSPFIPRRHSQLNH
jgi:hypothetical protein